jgi:hypothetical protein
MHKLSLHFASLLQAFGDHGVVAWTNTGIDASLVRSAICPDPGDMGLWVVVPVGFHSTVTCRPCKLAMPVKANSPLIR